MRSRDWLIAVAILAPLPLTVLGAKLESTVLLYTMLATVAVIVALVACTKVVNERLYPLAVFTISVSLLFQTTLVSPYPVGTDIHPEYYYYTQALNGWDLSVAGQYNLSAGLTVLAPLLTNVLHIDGVWIFKVIYPLLGALAPVLLYFAFRGIIGSRRSFVACFFFVSIPTYMMELIGITKLQLGGLCLGLLMFLLLYRKWPGWLRLCLGIVASTALVAIHYSTGYIYIYFLIAMALGVLLVGLLKLGKPSLPIWVHVSLLGIVVLVSVVYFTVLGSKFANPFNVVDVGNLFSRSAESITRQEPSVLAAIGADIFSVPFDAAVFRLLQISTEALIVAGLAVMLYRTWKKQAYPLEYAVLCVAGMALLGMCVIFPIFSRLLNMTRFYFLTLFMLAPLIVIGGEWVLQKVRLRRVALPVLTCGLLIPYFAFTSGAVFELEQRPNANTMDIPYSIALSHNRLDIAAIFTESDHEVLEWAMAQEDRHSIFGDVHARLFTMEWIGPEGENAYLVKDLSMAPDRAWVYLRDRNEQTQTLTFTDLMLLGTRTSYSYEELGVAELLEGRPLLYHSGNAKIYGSRGGE